MPFPESDTLTSATPYSAFRRVRIECNTAAALIRPTALFDGNCKDIAEAAFGPDDTWHLRVCLQFPPQPQHLNIDAAIEDVFVEPGRLQQILARKRSLRRIEQGQQQGVLAFAKGHRPFLRIDEAPAATIKPPSAELVSAPLDVAGAQGRSAHTAPQHGAEPGIQFADTERLGEVVVGTEFESDNTVNVIVGTSCQNDDRNV